ncbi:hypothetical protein D9M71_620880 [compost metagenome]
MNALVLPMTAEKASLARVPVLASSAERSIRSAPRVKSLIRSQVVLVSPMSARLPKKKVSLPVPPIRLSLPVPPVSRSLPAPPDSVSLPAPPFSWLLPALPVKVLARALPVAFAAAVPDRVSFSWLAPRTRLTLEINVSIPPVALVSETTSAALST